MKPNKFFENFMRDIIFGAEDGLVSILGLLIGVAQATSSTSTILISGIAGSAAAAVSMSAGNYLSTKSQKEVLESKKKSSKMIKPLSSAIVIGVVFFIVSLFPIAPFIFLNPNIASLVSIVVTFLVLFSIGSLKTIITKRNWFKSGIEMVIVAGLSALIGYFIGKIFLLTGI